jgi:PIN domain nuclease of toxin-antitoxin system
MGGDEVTGSISEEGSDSPRLLLDTHVIIWHLDGNQKIGRRARAAIDAAALGRGVLVSAITPWEIGMLVSKGRLQLQGDVMEWIRTALEKRGVLLVPLDPEIAVASTRLPFEMHPDPADRILVATARHLGATLVTADRELLELARRKHFAAMNAAR